jgi:hypothetical protein
MGHSNNLKHIGIDSKNNPERETVQQAAMSVR